MIPIWSVIIPVYNKAEFLDRCLSSLLDQTMTNWEAICIDDCSSDDSIEVLKRFRNNDSRFVVLSNEENVGVGESRNRGIKKARGMIIHFLDADDYLAPDHLNNCYKEMIQCNADIGFHRLVIEKENNQKTNIAYVGPSGIYGKELSGIELLHEFIANEDSFMYACDMVSRRTFLIENDLFFKSLKVGEGGDLILRALCVAKRAIKLDNCEGYHYCCNSSSINVSPNAAKLLLLGQLEQYATMQKMLLKHPDEAIYREFLEWYINYISGGFRNLALNDLHTLRDELDDEYLRFCLHTILNYKRHDFSGINKNDLNILQKSMKVVVFGAGYDSEKAVSELHMLDIEIIGIYVSDTSKNRRTILGHLVEAASKLQNVDRDIPILVTTKSRHHNEVEHMLKQMGFKFICLYGINDC